MRKYTIFYYIENGAMKISRILYPKINLNNLVKEENEKFMNKLIH